MIPELCESRHQAPKRKLRGKRRRVARMWRDARREADEFPRRLAAEGWWDLAHYHADLGGPGWSPRSWALRLEGIRALTHVFRAYADAAPRIRDPFQTWLLLSGRDASEDAVYLHSPNPNGTPFPVRLDDVDWSDDRLAPLLSPLLSGLDLRFGHRRGPDPWADPPRETSTFYVYAAGVGVELAP